MQESYVSSVCGLRTHVSIHHLQMKHNYTCINWNVIEVLSSFYAITTLQAKLYSV